MSIVNCHKCQTFIDSDNEDPWDISTDDCQEMTLEFPLCQSCKQEFEGLLTLKAKMDQFSQDIFDWVGCIGAIDLLVKVNETKERVAKLTSPKMEDHINEK